MPRRIEISHKTIIFTVAFLLLLWFIFQIREIIAWIFISFIVMSALKPTVDHFQKYKIPRALSIILIYIGIFIILGFTVSSIIPPLVSQSLRLSESLPSYIKLINPSINLNPQNYTDQISALGKNLVTLSVGIFNNLVSLFTIFVLSFYLLLERKNLDSYLFLLLGKSSGEKIEKLINKVENRLGFWVRGQLTLLLSIGILTYFGLLILQIPYALPLAIIAGLLEIIPTIGPIISSIPAIIVSFTVSSYHPVFTVILYFIIQQLENQAIVPLVMSRIVGVPPLVTILAILVGVRIGGIGGAVLAVPIVVTLETIFRGYYELNLPEKKSIEHYSETS